MIIKTWLLQKTDLEQKIVLALVAVSVLLLIYALLYLPVTRENKQLNLQNITIKDDMAEMKVLEQYLKGSSNRPVITEKLKLGEVIELIEKEARKIGLNPQMSQQGQDKVSVKLTKAEFNTAMRWVAELKNKYQMNISYFSAEAKDNGLGNIKVVVNL